MLHKALLVTAAFFLAGCAREKRPEPVLQIVRAGVVEEIRPDVPARFSVSIAPYAVVNLAFKSGGIIEDLLQVRGADGRVRDVQAGDKVRANARLAQVRPLDYKYRVDQAEAQRAQAAADSTKAQAQLAQARAILSESEIEYKRARNLFQAASLVKPEYDRARGRYESDAESVAAAANAAKAAEDNLAEAQAAAKEAHLSLAAAALRAPFAGWVAARTVDRGSVVSGSTVGFTVFDTHLVKAAFAVPDTALWMVHLGRKQLVKLDAFPHAVAGVITSISPAADPQSRVFNIEVTIQNPREEIRPGMLGSVTLSGSADLRPRIVVPLSAVVRAPGDPNGFAVFLLTERGGKTYAVAQTIGIGQTFGNSIEVTRGLAAGQKIVALGGEQVRSGQQVRVVP